MREREIQLWVELYFDKSIGFFSKKCMDYGVVVVNFRMECWLLENSEVFVDISSVLHFGCFRVRFFVCKIMDA